MNMSTNKEGAISKEGAPCQSCRTGHYRAVKVTGSPVTPAGFQFGVGGKIIIALVFICDSCGHIEFFNAPREVEDPNA